MIDDYHHTHCAHCFDVLKCINSSCPLVQCPLKCSFKLHECKLAEHLAETCSLREINCINESNGCKIKVKKCNLSKHLEKCCANVVQCSSFRMRKIVNKFEKNKRFKFPDPISDTIYNKVTNEIKSLNDLLLEQDYELLEKFCKENPLKFQRMYGYLIGLKLNPNSSEFRLSFLNLLLKTVKSRVFKDIEAENCIVFNDDVGCIACQTRIKYLEMARFDKLKKDRYHFDFILKDIITYEQFIEQKIHTNPQFLNAYEEFYLKPNCDESKINPVINESKEELDKKLQETNSNLLDSIELNPVMKLNVAKELPCDAFQITYESYRINDSHFSIDCSSLLRRDEFSHHYNTYHNFILNNSELIDHNCPFNEYGCPYFKTKYDFMFTNSFDYKHDLDNNLLNAVLNHDKQTNQITFRLNNLNEQINESSDSNFLDLPLDVLYEIFEKLDSLSIYYLSQTSKALRELCAQFLCTKGIVYPKWVKRDDITSDTNNNDVKRTKKWIVEKYAYSFSKHVEPPKKIMLKNLTQKNDNYNQHVQNCPYRICKHIDEPFRIFPPYTKKT